jgi:osmoprotectant transport system ATP-binding protein
MIQVEGLSRRYGATDAVADVSFQVAPGQLLALVGDSGSGKTTTLKMINRLVEPSAGKVLVEGRDTAAVEPHALRRSIGYVFQGIGLFPHMTVAENIAITPKLLGWDAAQMSTRVDELIDLVRLDRVKHRDRFSSQLSGGEAQRVGVARALAAQPHIVLMDEPFGALDPLTRDALGQDYRRLHDELGLTTVMITHDTLEAVLLADRIAIVRAGKIIAEGAPHTLMNDTQDDYVRELMATPRRQAERLSALVDRPAPG